MLSLTVVDEDGYVCEQPLRCSMQQAHPSVPAEADTLTCGWNIASLTWITNRLLQVVLERGHQ